MNSTINDGLVPVAVDVGYIPADDNSPRTSWRAEIETRGEEQRWCEIRESGGSLLGSAVVPPQAGTSLLKWVADCLDAALAESMTSERRLEPGLGSAVVSIAGDEVAEVAFGFIRGEVWYYSSVDQDQDTNPTLWSIVVKALRRFGARPAR